MKFYYSYAETTWGIVQLSDQGSTLELIRYAQLIHYLFLPGMSSALSLIKITLKCFLHVYQNGIYVKVNDSQLGIGLFLFCLYIQFKPQNSSLCFRSTCSLLTMVVLVVRCEPPCLPDIDDMAVCSQESGNAMLVPLTPGTRYLLWGGVHALRPSLLAKLSTHLCLNHMKALCC